MLAWAQTAYIGNVGPAVNTTKPVDVVELVTALQNNSVTRIVLIRDYSVQASSWQQYSARSPLNLSRNVTITSLDPVVSSTDFRKLDFNFLSGMVLLKSGVNVTFLHLALDTIRCGGSGIKIHAVTTVKLQHMHQHAQSSLGFAHGHQQMPVCSMCATAWEC